MNPSWISVTVTVISVLLGVGVLWGTLRSAMSHMESNVERLETAVDNLEELFYGLREEVRVRFAQQPASSPKRGKAKSKRRAQ